MRQGQQNRRGRGRSRKPQNPLARNYESNGPDVKIRGTAAHVAEKYMSLARDALSSGDPIAAESYLQHAEHYNRIIMAAHSQAAGPQAGEQPQGQQQANGGAGRGRQNADEDAETDSEGTAEAASGEAGSDAAVAPSEGRGRGRGRQRRNNGSHAATEAQATTETQATGEAHATTEANGAAEANGPEQPVEVGAAEETEGASGTVS
jgi:hypothetical protein